MWIEDVEGNLVNSDRVRWFELKKNVNKKNEWWLLANVGVVGEVGDRFTLAMGRETHVRVAYDVLKTKLGVDGGLQQVLLACKENE